VGFFYQQTFSRQEFDSDEAYHFCAKSPKIMTEKKKFRADRTLFNKRGLDKVKGNAFFKNPENEKGCGYGL
jgi:hypothetical protein